MRTQVGIVGAGPAGLVLAHLLHLAGIESIVIEDKSRALYRASAARRPARAGQRRAHRSRRASGERMLRERMVHEGLYLKFKGELHRLDFQDLVGKSVMIYAQQELVKDLVALRLGYGAPHPFRGRRRDARRSRRAAPEDPLHRNGGRRARSSATTSPAATASTASAGPASRPARSLSSTAIIPSPGSASSPRRRRPRTSSSIPITSAASRFSPCARRR